MCVKYLRPQFQYVIAWGDQMNKICLRNGGCESISNSRAEKGSALISVLFILLLITIVGSLAMRQGLTSLNLSTSTQAQTLLMQSSDDIFFQLADVTKNQANSTAGQGLFNVASQLKLDSFLTGGGEMVFCYRPQNIPDLFNGSSEKSYITSDDTGANITNDALGTSGFCHANQVLDYTSPRKAVMTQVSVKECSGPPGACMVPGCDPEVCATKQYRINAISVLPNLAAGTVSNSDIDNCLKNYMNDVPYTSTAPTTQATVTDCLAQHNIPFNSQAGDIQLSTGG